MGWWQSVISRDGAADAFEMRCRKTVMAVCLSGTPIAAFTVMTGELHLAICAGYLNLFLMMVTLIWGVCKRRFTQRFMIFFVAVACVTVSVLDLHFYQADLQVAWPLFVVVIDLILVLRLDHRLATVMVCFVVTWLLLNLVERVTRFGLYDVGMSDSYETRRERYAKRVDCDKPPCKSDVSDSVSYQGIGLFVFLLDYVATRGFAQPVLKEQAAMHSTVATVESIASLLAAYDVDAVSQILGDDRTVLPRAMRAALLRLEQNLRAYRPYLPKSCLPCAQCDDGEDADASVSRDVSQTTGSVTSDKAGSNSGSASGSDAPVRLAEPLRPQGLSMKRAALLFVNMSGSGALLQDSMHAFEQAFADTLATTLQCVEQRAGIVDLFVGDRMCCSFNTSRTCMTYSNAALHAAKDALFGAGAVRGTASAVTGKACCGDIGCADMRRFSVVGTLPAQAHIIERAGATVGLPLVCNKACQQDSECTHEMRLVPLRVGFPVSASKGADMPVEVADEVHVLYEVRPSDSRSDAPASPAEWMYELDYRSNIWYAYNSAVAAYLQGARMEDALELAGDRHEALTAALQSVGSRDVLRIVV